MLILKLWGLKCHKPFSLSSFIYYITDFCQNESRSSARKSTFLMFLMSLHLHLRTRWLNADELNSFILKDHRKHYIWTRPLDTLFEGSVAFELYLDNLAFKGLILICGDFWKVSKRRWGAISPTGIYFYIFLWGMKKISMCSRFTELQKLHFKQ